MGPRRIPPHAAAALLGTLLAVPTAVHARRSRVPEALTPDQELVVAEVVNDTFRLSRTAPTPLALCLDVQLSELPLDAEPPPAPPPKPGRAHVRAPKPPAPPPLRGAPEALVERLARPWRPVSSALACRLDPREPFTLNDARRTPARLVIVHMTAHVASGALKIDWTDGKSAEATATSSRDCTATRTPRGWSVRCGGTWAQ